MDNKDRDNKFWKGVLAGALVTAFAGLLVVGLSAGIFLFGNGIIKKAQKPKGPGYELEQQASNGAQVSNQSSAEAESEEKKDELDYQQIIYKMKMMQSLIDDEFLFEKDYQKIEDTIYLGKMCIRDRCSTEGRPYAVVWMQYESQAEGPGRAGKADI